MKQKELSQAGLDAHYTTFYETQEKDFRASSVARLVFPLLDPANTVLDVGCGSCTVSSFLLEKKLPVVSVDTSEEMIEMGRRYLAERGLPSNRLFHLDLDGCLRTFEAPFEQIICLDVIEHIGDDEGALESLFQLLTPGGTLILSVPALQSLFGPKDRRVGHYRRYGRKELVQKMKTAGFEIESVRWWNFLGAGVTWFYLKVLRRGVDEGFRASRSGGSRKWINTLLRVWCTQLENRIPFPIGLTLLVVARRLKK